MVAFKDLNWKFVVLLAGILLVRPVIKILGFLDGTEPAGPIMVTVLIAIIWVALAVWQKANRPVATLIMAGVVYALTSILLAIVIQTVNPGMGGESVSISVLVTAGLAGSLVTNIVWGGVLGFVSHLMIGLRK